MNNDASLKEYYIKLEKLYNNAINMLSALNESLTTSSNEITLNITDSDDAVTTVKIPSFIYLESKLEELNSNIDTLFNIPNDGEAWFDKNENTYKLNLVRSNIAPIAPIIDKNYYASITDNNILKDLVSPKTFLKLNISNLPDIISEMFMRKIVIYDESIFNSIMQSSSNGEISYETCKAMLYNLKKGNDYDEYDSTLKMPIKKDHYRSAFKIKNILNGGLPWKNDNDKLVYKIELDTLLYYNEEDSAVSYILKIGDYICLGNSAVVYKVIDVLVDNTILIEEYVGHANLVKYDENNNMIFQYYFVDYSKYEYVEVPLEENQFIIVFLGSIYNNVRSILSSGLLIDLSTIDMIDKNGQPILDSKGNQYKYLNYYNDYCTNLGDLILGMSTCAYSQITNYTYNELNNLLYSDDIKNCVNLSFDNNILKVVAINKHLTDDLSNTDIINLHNQKNEINSKLQTCQSNIDSVYSTLLTTDFSQNVTITQQSLQEKIQGYYTERTSLQKQLNAIIDNINSKSDTLYNDSKIKYRLRGVSDTTQLDNYLKQFKNVYIIGTDIEYKYKSTNKDTTSLTNINGSTFTDWNKYYNIEKERNLVFENGSYSIKYVDYAKTINEIKWNQFDIPIREGEDVVVRVRYKYSVGQPYISLYTPWSDEYTFVFPTEFTENIEVNSIIDTNNKDLISSTFSKTLIDDGYTEHIQNKVLSNEQVFFHMPENIYSGFNTSENNLISLKDKLTQMANDIENYKSYIDGLANTSFEIYLNYDDNSVLLSPNSINKINIYNTDHITDMFIKKEMNIIIKNTGSTRLNLYSIFPGNIDEHLITSNNTYYNINKGNYERVPIFIDNKLDGQYLNQWIYFRSTNPYNNSDIYFNDIKQNAFDFNTIINYEGQQVDENERILTFRYNLLDYMKNDNSQVLLGFRNNNYISGFNYNLINKTEENTVEEIEKNVNNILNQYSTKYINVDNILSNFNTFKYKEYNEINENQTEYFNQYILRYEDIIVQETNQKSFYLDKNSILSEVVKKIKIKNNNDEQASLQNTEDLIGGFLYPNLLSKAQIIIDNNSSAKYIEVGNSLSIPIVFEYYVESNKSNIIKSIYFDIKNSLISEPMHYMLEVTGNYDYTTTGEIYKDIDEIIS